MLDGFANIAIGAYYDFGGAISGPVDPVGVLTVEPIATEGFKYG